MKKILFITYYWPPSGGAGVQRSLKFVKYLPSFGIEPFVLTVNEKFASYPLHDETLSAEIDNRINVVKTKSLEALKLLSLFTNKKNIPHGGFANSNKEKPFQKLLRYLRGNLFIPDARIGWIRYAVKAASKIIIDEKIDTVFITSPPHSSQLIGLKLKQKFNIRWIADLRDPWTDIYYYKDLLHSKRAANKDAGFELSVLQNADDIITVSAPISKMYLNKSVDLHPGKFHEIPNGFDEDDFKGDGTSSDDVFILTYVGSIAESYKPEPLFEAVKKAINEFPGVKFKIRFVGSMPSSVRQLLHSLKLEDITEFIAHVDHSSAINFMRTSSALLLLIPEVSDNEGILTGKLFEYLASRRPIIALGPVNGKASSILDECNAGKMFERHDTIQLYSYLKTLILHHIEKPVSEPINGNYLKYSRKTLAGNLASIILKEN